MSSLDDMSVPLEDSADSAACSTAPTLLSRIFPRWGVRSIAEESSTPLSRVGKFARKALAAARKLVPEALASKAAAAWPILRKLGIYFCAFSVVGHLVEWPYCWAGMKFFGTVDPAAEVLTNPLKPFFVYGFGIVLCSIALNPLRDCLKDKCPTKGHAFLSFYAISVFLGMAFELIQGFTQNRPVDGVYPLWDVSDYPGNILGQAWIVNDILLGALMTFIVWVVLPPLDRAMDRLSDTAANRLFAAVVGATLLLTAITY